MNISQKYSRQAADKVTAQIDSLEIVPQFSENEYNQYNKQYAQTSKKDIDSLLQQR